VRRAKIYFFFFIVFCCLHERASAQGLAAYLDYRNYFNVFDNGIFQQIEYLPVKSFQVGGSAIPYVDNTGEFQIYYAGNKYHQTYAADLTYSTSDYLTAYKIGYVLSVFEKGITRKVTYNCSGFYIDDSLVVYFDDSNYNLNVYYNGESMELESSMLELPREIQTGSNMVAYVNQSGYFKLFYHGEVNEIDNVAPVSFLAGRDIAAFVDGYNHAFKIFYKGDVAEADVNAPQSYKVGFGSLAYIDYEDNLRIFSNGSTRKLLSSRPDFYSVQGNVIVYGYNNELHIFQNGESKLVDDVVPTDYKLGNNGIAYIDSDNHLKYYSKGKSYVVSFEPVVKYYINNDVIWYKLGVNTWKVFANGQTY
jgi:hypothetical protein